LFKNLEIKTLDSITQETYNLGFHHAVTEDVRLSGNTRATAGVLMSAFRTLFWQGVRDVSPLILGILPFALISGAVSIAAGLSGLETMGMALIIFAGASQLATVQLLEAGAAWPVVVLTAAVINLRMLMYSASIASHFQNLSLRWKGLIGYLLTDQAYALPIVRFQKGELKAKHAYYLGVALTLWLVWQIGSLGGILLGAQIPPDWSLDFSIPLMFLALLVPALTDRPATAAAVAAGCVSILAAGLPFNLGLVLGALVGILIGVWVEGKTP